MKTKVDLQRAAWLGSSLTSGFILALGIISGILVARLLLPEGRGALAGILFWPQIFAGIGILSLNEAVTYRISQEPEKRDTVLSAAFQTVLIIAFVAVLAGYFLLPYLLGALRSEYLHLAKLYLLGFIPLNLVALTLLAVDHGEQKFGRYNGLRLLVPLFYVIGLMLLWIANEATLERIIWINLAANAIIVLLRLLLAGKAIFIWPDFRLARELLIIGGRFHAATLLVLLGSQVDKFIVIKRMGDIDLGLYTVAFTFASSGMGILTTTYQTVLFPQLARMTNAQEQIDMLAGGLRQAMLLLCCGTAVLMVLSGKLMPFLFGAEYAPATLVTQVLLLAYVPMALRQILLRSLRGLGDARGATYAELTAALLILGGGWYAVPYFGIVGVAWALLIANVLAFAYLSIYLKRRFNLSPQQWWGLDLRTVREFLAIGRDFGKTLKPKIKL